MPDQVFVRDIDFEFLDQSQEGTTATLSNLTDGGGEGGGEAVGMPD
jgi:hypothetical protein